MRVLATHADAEHDAAAGGPVDVGHLLGDDGRGEQREQHDEVPITAVSAIADSRASDVMRLGHRIPGGHVATHPERLDAHRLVGAYSGGIGWRG